MREIRLSGSVEGVVSNHDPYSDLANVEDANREIGVPGFGNEQEFWQARAAA